MSVKVAINGFGRIGRNVLRAARSQRSPFEIVAVNDITDLETRPTCCSYDSVHGRFPGTVEVGDDG